MKPMYVRLKQTFYCQRQSILLVENIILQLCNAVSVCVLGVFPDVVSKHPLRAHCPVCSGALRDNQLYSFGNKGSCSPQQGTTGGRLCETILHFYFSFIQK